MKIYDFNNAGYDIRKKFQQIFGFPIPLDHLFLATGNICLDVLKFDELLGHHISDYDPDKCTYKGKPGYSCSKVIEKHFGKDVLEFVELLMN
jgi:hypothetical protein